ncbi:MAG: hypothetical protein M3Y93_03105 [Pseudomonadota bacterium]|nr:hypothetical protein [Pseudomonadota bacterium]
MKFRKLSFIAVTGSALLSTAVAFAQDVPPPPTTDMAQPMPPSGPMPASSALPPSSSMPQQIGSTSMETPAGQLTLKSTMPPAPPNGPTPSFAQLSGGGTSISEDQAAAYPLLANDFIHADRHRDHRISQSEYRNWLSQK